MTAHSDFEAACDHFGMRHLLVDMTPLGTIREMRDRRARAGPPSTGTLPLML